MSKEQNKHAESANRLQRLLVRPGMPLYSQPLMEIPPLEVAKLWGELVECFYRVNGFGGDTAEIYSYRFQQFTPIAHSELGKRHNNSESNEIFRELCGKAACALSALVEMFCEYYGCDATIGGMTIRNWVNNVFSGNVIYDHRTHVTILRESRSNTLLEQRGTD